MIVAFCILLLWNENMNMIMTVHDSLSFGLKKQLHATNYVMAVKASFKNR
jgi:hypothetical protein